MAQFGYSLDTALGQVYGDKRAAARQEWERIRREVDSGCCDKEGHPAELKHMPSKQLETELQGKLRLLYSNNLMQNFDYSKIMGSLREYYLEQRLRREEELAAGTTSAEVQTGAGAHRQQERLPQQVPHTDGSVWLKQAVDNQNEAITKREEQHAGAQGARPARLVGLAPTQGNGRSVQGKRLAQQQEQLRQQRAKRPLPLAQTQPLRPTPGSAGAGTGQDGNTMQCSVCNNQKPQSAMVRVSGLEVCNECKRQDAAAAASTGTTTRSQQQKQQPQGRVAGAAKLINTLAAATTSLQNGAKSMLAMAGAVGGGMLRIPTMRSNTTNYQLESAQDPAGGPTSIRAKKFYGSGGGGPGGSASGPGAGRESAATEGPAPAAGGGVKTRRSAAPAPAPADGAGPGPSDARAGRKGTARKPAGRGASTEEGPERKHEEPILIDDTTDEEADAQRPPSNTPEAGALDPGEAAGAAGAAGAGTRRRSARQGGGAGGGSAHFQTLSEKLAGLKCCYPPDGGKHSVEVTAEDLARLEPREFLNDTCIDFYIKYVEHNLPPEIRSRCHFFNSFFLKKLQEKPKGRMDKDQAAEAAFERVKKWTKHVDLFAKDYIFVPVHATLHWSLVVVCHPRRVAEAARAKARAEARAAAGQGERASGTGDIGSAVMLHLDSLDGSHAPGQIFECLRGYLGHEWRRKAKDGPPDCEPRRYEEERNRAQAAVVMEGTPGTVVVPPEPRFDKSTLRGIRMTDELPRQDNHVDCGLFLLSYLEFFAVGNPSAIEPQGGNARDVGALFIDEGEPLAADRGSFLRRSWFKKANAGVLRDYLRYLICRLMRDKLADPTDLRRAALDRVVEDYEARPHQMGRVYLQPREYLEYVRARPTEPEPPPNDADVLGSSEDEWEKPPPAAKAPAPGRRMTRSAVKVGEAPPLPDHKLPLTEPKDTRRRKVAAAGQAPVQPPTVNLCSPEKSSGREGHNGAREGSPEGSQEEDVVEMEAEEGTGVGASGKAASRRGAGKATGSRPRKRRKGAPEGDPAAGHALPVPGGSQPEAVDLLEEGKEMETDGRNRGAAVAAATSPADGDAEAISMDEDSVGSGSDRGEQEMEDTAGNPASLQQFVADDTRTVAKDEDEEPYHDEEVSEDLVAPRQAAEAAGDEPAASEGTGGVAASSPLAGYAEQWRGDLTDAGAKVYDSQDPERLPQACGGPAHAVGGAGGGTVAMVGEGGGTDREQEEEPGVGAGKPKAGSKVARASARKRGRARKADQRGAAAAGGCASEELEDGAGAGGAGPGVVMWAQRCSPPLPPTEYSLPQVSPPPCMLVPMPEHAQQPAGGYTAWGGSSNSAGEGGTVGTALPGSDGEDGADQVVLDSQGSQQQHGGSQGEGEEEREWGPVETGQFDDAGDPNWSESSQGRGEQDGADGLSEGHGAPGEGWNAEKRCRSHRRWDERGQVHEAQEPIDDPRHALAPRCQPQHGQRPERLIQQHNLQAPPPQQQQLSHYPPPACRGGGMAAVRPPGSQHQQLSRSLLQSRPLAGRETAQAQLPALSAQLGPSAQGMHGANCAKRAASHDGPNLACSAQGNLALQEGSGLGWPHGATSSGGRGGGGGAPGATNGLGYGLEAGHQHKGRQGDSHGEQDREQQHQPEPHGRHSGRQSQFPCQEAHQEQQHVTAPGGQEQGQGQRERPSSTGSGWRGMGVEGDSEEGRVGSGGGRGKRSSGGRKPTPGSGCDQLAHMAQAQPPQAGFQDLADCGQSFLYSQSTGGSHNSSRALGPLQQQQHGPVLDLGDVPPPGAQRQSNATVSPPGGRVGAAAGANANSLNAPALFNQHTVVGILSAGGAVGGGCGGSGTGLPARRDPRQRQHVPGATLPAAAGGDTARGVGAEHQPQPANEAPGGHVHAAAVQPQAAAAAAGAPAARTGPASSEDAYAKDGSRGGARQGRNLVKERLRGAAAPHAPSQQPDGAASLLSPPPAVTDEQGPSQEREPCSPVDTNSHSQEGVSVRSRSAKSKAGPTTEASSAGRCITGGQGDSPGVAPGGGVAAAPITAGLRSGAGGAATQGTRHGAGMGSDRGADGDDGFLQLHLGSGQGSAAPGVAHGGPVRDVGSGAAVRGKGVGAGGGQRGDVVDDVDLTNDEDGTAAAEEAGEKGTGEEEGSGEAQEVLEVEERSPEPGGGAWKAAGRAGVAGRGAATAGQPGSRGGPANAAAAVAPGGGGAGRKGGETSDVPAEGTGGAYSGPREEDTGRGGQPRNKRLSRPDRKRDGESLTGRHDPHHKRQQQSQPHHQQQQQHSASASEADSDVVVVSPGGDGWKQELGNGRGTSAQHGNGGEEAGEESDDDDFVPPTGSTRRGSKRGSTPYRSRSVSSEEDGDNGQEEEEAGGARAAGGRARSSRKEGRQSEAYPVYEDGVRVQGAGKRRSGAQEGGGDMQTFRRRRGAGPDRDAPEAPPDQRHGSGTGAAGATRAEKRTRRDDANKHQPHGTPAAAGPGATGSKRSKQTTLDGSTLQDEEPDRAHHARKRQRNKHNAPAPTPTANNGVGGEGGGRRHRKHQQQLLQLVREPGRGEEDRSGEGKRAGAAAQQQPRGPSRASDSEWHEGAQQRLNRRSADFPRSRGSALSIEDD